jgi:hypothetical protein
MHIEAIIFIGEPVVLKYINQLICVAIESGICSDEKINKTQKIPSS